MRRRLAAALVLVAACGGGSSDLQDLATETCGVLADPETSLAARSLIVFESTTQAIEMGYTEEDFAEALREECPGSVIIGGDS